VSITTLDATAVRRWKRYPEYRRLPLDWKLAIPAHWNQHRLKEVASVRPSNVDKKTVDGERAVRLCNYVDVYNNDRITADMEFMEATATDAQIEQFSIRGGDVIITKDSETWDDIAVPAHVPQAIEGLVCGYHLALIRPDPRRFEGSFLARCFAAEGLSDQFRIAANGITRYGLDTQSIKCAVFPVPPLAEQRAIASFIDRETARIDALISHKERLIALLEEKRQAVISHAVTRGLDPAAPLKDSGVPWLGGVPKHWGVLPLKRLAIRVDVGIAEASTHAYQDDGVPIIRSTNVRRNYVDTNDIYYINSTFAEKNRSKYLRSGDLVTTRTGANLGMTAVVPPELDQSQCFTLLVTTLRDSHHSQFYSYFMNAAPTQFYFLVEGWGAGQHNLSVPIIQEMPVPIPPSEEQRQILDYILQITMRSEELVAKLHHGIARLQEYRTVLISAAVTGQIDVRGEVTP
jgi:type I restriction enzyme, S subunit